MYINEQKIFYKIEKILGNIIHIYLQVFWQMIPEKEKELLPKCQFWSPFCQTFIFVYLMKKLIIAKLQKVLIIIAILSDRRLSDLYLCL